MFYGIPPERYQQFSDAMAAIGQIYGNGVFASDMLITLQRNLSFLADPPFTQALSATAQSDKDRSLVWRLHTLAWAADSVMHVDGDFVECGVFKGFSSAMLCKYLDFGSLPRKFYLYDTFSGLAEATSTPRERTLWKSYGEEDPTAWLAEVRDRFSAYPNVEIVPGMVPESFAQASPAKIALLHLDMNSTKAEILALEQLFERISPGGMLVLDDFGWAAHREQMVAETEFLKVRGHRILELPTGQGLVVNIDAPRPVKRTQGPIRNLILATDFAHPRASWPMIYRTDSPIWERFQQNAQPLSS